MGKKIFHRLRRAFIPALALVITVSWLVTVSGQDNPEAGYAGLITVDLPHVESKEQMPPVTFPHDRHVDATGGKQSCTKCHLDKDGKLVLRFKDVDAAEPVRGMQIYHDSCVACHEQFRAGNKPSGPLQADCRSCHDSNPPANDRWVMMDFDRGLHFRHEKAAAIVSPAADGSGNCGACHHLYDKEKQKTYYQKGREDNCRYCHLQQASKDASGIRQAAHNSCVVCHRDLMEKGAKAGPLTCRACHLPAEQKKIKRPAKVARLERNQPDKVLLASWARKPAGAEQKVEGHLPAVVFDHKLHEAGNAKCITCHHKSLQSCASCHNQKAGEKGGFVSLETAMHTTGAARSCLGCHRQKRQAASCGGCHWMDPAPGALPAKDCKLCHAVEVKAEDLPLDRQTAELLAAAAAQGNGGGVETQVDKVPETVVIGSMSQQYQPVEFPHRKVFEAIGRRIKDDRLAAHFHRNGQVLCGGCHHNSPPSAKPPRCAACHLATETRAVDGRPWLKGAYHGQCITCHQKMGVKPGANDCTKCHPRKQHISKQQTTKS